MKLPPLQTLEPRLLLATTGDLRGRVLTESSIGPRTQPVAGIRVFLDDNHNDNRDPGERRTTTDANGRYRFDSVPAGSHRIVLARPHRTRSIDPEPYLDVDLAPDQLIKVDPIFTPPKTGSIVATHGLLFIRGTRGNDVISVRLSKHGYRVVFNDQVRIVRVRRRDVYQTFILTGEGNDLVTTGRNVSADLRGGDGDDTLRGGARADFLSGDEGDDLLIGGSGRGFDDFLYGGPGNDTLYGQGGNDTVGDFMGDDSLFGGDGNDQLYAARDGVGDLIDGGRGRDAAGADRLPHLCPLPSAILCTAGREDIVVRVERIGWKPR